MSFTSAIPTKFIVSSKQSFLSHRDRTTYTLEQVESDTDFSLRPESAPQRYALRIDTPNGYPCNRLAIGAVLELTLTHAKPRSKR